RTEAPLSARLLRQQLSLQQQQLWRLQHRLLRRLPPHTRYRRHQLRRGAIRAADRDLRPARLRDRAARLPAGAAGLFRGATAAAAGAAATGPAAAAPDQPCHVQAEAQAAAAILDAERRAHHPPGAAAVELTAFGAALAL